MNKKPIVDVPRMTADYADVDGTTWTLTDVEDGELCGYDTMLHFFKECLEHGLTLKEAIDWCEKHNGR